MHSAEFELTIFYEKSNSLHSADFFIKYKSLLAQRGFVVDDFHYYDLHSAILENTVFLEHISALRKDLLLLYDVKLGQH